MPYGNLNVDTITTSVSGGILGAGNASIMKNRIINGAMVIDQRNAGASLTNGAGLTTYCVDRWNFYGTSASKFTAQQNAGSVTLPVGFSKYLGFTSLAATTPASSDFYYVVQPIEGFNFADVGFGTANAKTVTLSFQVYSSLTGTFSGCLGSGTRSYPFTYSVPVANTWTTISVTVAGDTAGTWVGATNATAINVFFNLGSGSTNLGSAGAWASANYVGATGSVNVLGTSGATFYITGVQLEVGSSATGFEYRQYGQELALCQRYFQKTYNTNVAVGTITNDGSLLGIANGNGNRPIVNWCFSTVMRVNPTSTTYSPTTGTAGKIRNLDTSTDLDGLVLFSGMTGMNWYPNGVPSNNNGISAHVTASAEL